MKKMIVLILILSQILFAETIEIKKFKSDIFSRISKKPQKVEMMLMIEGRDVEENSFKIIDALNIVIGSFYLEDIMTSRGKENFKKTMKIYVTEKYGIDIDEIYIQRFYVRDRADTEEIINAMKEAGCCKDK